MFDDSPLALVVLTDAGDVYAANASARERFGRVETGVPFWTLLPDAAAAEAWWTDRYRPEAAPLVVRGWTFTARPLADGLDLLEAPPPLSPLVDPALRRLANALPAIVWFVGEDGNNRFINRYWYEFTGSTLPHDQWWQHLHPDDAAATQDAWNDAFAAQQAFVMEYRFRRHDGDYVWHLVHALPQRHADGTLWGWVGLCTSLELLERDAAARTLLDDLARERSARQTLARTLDARVHERAELEAENQALQTRNRDLYDFAYVASHDLQEPLRKILSYADLLRLDFGEVLPEDAGFYVDRIHNAASRMSRLVRDLLVYSRLVTDTRPYEPVALGDVLKEVESDLLLALRESEGRIDAGPLPTVVGDATQLRQLLQNLVLNALKYRRDAVAPVVTLAGRVDPATAHAPERVVLTVSDNGRGFDNEDAERIFQPFQRLVGREVEGTGFGLAIVRRIAERHGGTVTATGTPGEGAVFTVTLPTRPAPAA